MKTQTMNMFAETNEDMPIISGATRTEPFKVAAPEYDADGLNGYYLDLYWEAAALTTNLLLRTDAIRAGRTYAEWKIDPQYIKVSRIAINAFVREGRRHQKYLATE